MTTEGAPAVKVYSNFNGTEFYQKYSNSKFLKTPKGRKFVIKVLSSAVLIKSFLEGKKETTFNRIKINDVDDLIVKKGTKDEVDVGDFDFTLKRLQGFCAAYAYSHPEYFDHRNTVVAMAASMQYELKENSTDDFRKFYFSFSPGSQNFSCVLGFWPIVVLLTLAADIKDKTILKSFLRKFKIKDDNKVKLMYQLKSKEVIEKITPVFLEREGDKIDFGECLVKFHFPRLSIIDL